MNQSLLSEPDLICSFSEVPFNQLAVPLCVQGPGQVSWPSLFAGLPAARRSVPCHGTCSWLLLRAGSGPGRCRCHCGSFPAAFIFPLQELCSRLLSVQFSPKEGSLGPGEHAVVSAAAVPWHEWHSQVSVAEARGELSGAGIRLHVENLSCFKDFPACIRACGAAHRLREDLWFGQGCLGCQRCLKME